VTGFVVVWFLLGYVRWHDFTPLVVYRLVVSALVLVLIATNVRPAEIHDKEVPSRSAAGRVVP
jgi:hypothetical protein